MPETIFKHGRYRPYIGLLESFNDLDPTIKEKFIMIKKEINKIIGEDTVSSVFGSWLWGYADKESDFDVLVDKLIVNRDISKEISNIVGFQVHISCVKEKNIQHKLILIP